MTEMVSLGREYWANAIGAGEATTIPRWTQNPVKGIAAIETMVSDELATALRDYSQAVAIPVQTLFLAAHARVLAALSGELEVTAAYLVDESTRPLPCRLNVEHGSWQTFVMDVDRRERELLSHSEYYLHNFGKCDAAFETVFAAGGEMRELDANAVLSLAISEQQENLRLHIQYRTEAFDAESANRIAGYHLTALKQMVAEPNADHKMQSLLSAEERHFQIEGLAGPYRELPDQRFHELFEEFVVQQPNAVAAECGGRIRTYRELNSHANRLGRALLEGGLQPEDVVAVVTQRNLDWLASALAVFKAGGVYLPIEPHFPSDRISNMLTRAACRFVVTEPGSDTSLNQALETMPNTWKFFAADAYGEGHSDEDLGIDVAADQAAYIYFTSGSTGEPKGAMCEHAGFLNHLYAKIDDLGVEEGQTIAQIAPQCFDISLWQLVAALIVGGRTHIVEQDVVLDVEKFATKIIDGKVSVMQVVPSYLEVLLSYLEQNSIELPDLHCVSVTGEALSKELTQRWFAAKPDIKLANAYGLTETCDDTNHEVMDRAPEGNQVPLGPCVNNVHVYVVDEQLSPVPLGAAGEIVFSGVCVGRGYVNDPDRTRQAFIDDPLREGERLYRSGDFGRWRPDGKLEFLGRQDAQVKIRGFRIEIGDIENNLMSVPGVRLGAVIVAESAPGSKQLVAFYSGEGPIDSKAIAQPLADALPEYMVPSIFHWRETLPLTANGKIDRKSLQKLAAELKDESASFDAPATPAEQTLAAAWAKVLGVPTETVGRSDHFFDRGGTSLSAVKLVIALKKQVSLKDIAGHPVLSDLAAVLGGGDDADVGLLQKLSDEDVSNGNALVCFPYAGGNAVNFQPIAKELKGSGTAVYAVELPGHDLSENSRSFASIAEVVDQVVSEVIAIGLTSVMLYGHSSGVAPTLEAARKLQAKGVDVRRVFLSAQLIGSAAARRAAIEELKQQSNTEIAVKLHNRSTDGALHELDPPRLELFGKMYRHDFDAANRYLADVLESPPESKLSAPVTVLGAADDSATAGLSRRYRDWQIVARQVDLHVLDGGGHYFLRTRPKEVANIILRAE
ncbi:MAG: amino acid adenylation domain-containing protein [Hyphomicrobiaceae bacterium]